MNITDESAATVAVVTKELVAVWLLLGVSCVYAFISYEFAHALLIFDAALLTGAAGVLRAWNRELREDTYAALNNYLSVVLSLGFFALPLYRGLSAFADLRITVGATLFTTVLCYLLLKQIAFYDVDPSELVYETDTASGPPVAYLTDGVYVEHIEQKATEE